MVNQKSGTNKGTQTPEYFVVVLTKLALNLVNCTFRARLITISFLVLSFYFLLLDIYRESKRNARTKYKMKTKMKAKN